MKRVGLLLVNLGTPESLAVGDVRKYLREFLMDPKVINIPWFFRFLLVYGVILPTRPRRSAAAYKKVWTEEGSPLLVSGQELEVALAKELGDGVIVKLAMRYGAPSLESGLEALLEEKLDQLLVLPLYPQYAAATTGSTVEKIFDILKARWNVPPVSIISDFYDDERFINSFAVVAREQLKDFEPDHVLYSFHGLPENHLTKRESGQMSCLKSPSCCEKIDAGNRMCYRAQCFSTAKALSTVLSLEYQSQTSVCFQSRLGKAEWIKPYTTEVIKDLLSKGKKRVSVICPAFVADCLETLEEIGIELRNEFIALGGEDLQLVTSLNSHPVWVESLANLVRDYARLEGK